MADFTTSYIGNSGMPSFPSQQGGGSSNASLTTAAASLFGSAVQGYMQVEQQNKAAEAQEATQRVMTDFQQMQLDVANAVESGQMSSAQGRRTMRTNYSQAIANNPALADALQKTHENIITTAGLGKVAAEGTEQEQQLNKLIGQAMADGWVTQSMSREEQEDAVFAHGQFKKAQEELAASTARYNNQKAKLGVKQAGVALSTSYINNRKAKLSLETAQHEATIKRSLGTLTSQGVERARMKAADIRKQVENGSLTVEQGMEMMEQERLTLTSTAREVSQGVGTGVTDDFISTVNDVFSTNMKYMSGEVSLDVLERQNELTMARQVALFNSDPKRSRVAAVSSIMPGNLSVLQGDANQAAIDFMDKGVNGEGDGADDDAPDAPSFNTPDAPASEKKEYFRALKGTADNIKRGVQEVTPATQKEVNRNLNGILRGVGSYGSLARNPSKLKEEMEFFADDSFLALSKGATVSSEARENAKNVVKSKVDGPLRDLMKDEWEKHRIITGTAPRPSQATARGRTPVQAESAARSDLVKPMVGPDGFVYFTATEDTPDAQASARKLNDTIGKPMKRLTKAQAHLDGNSNYGKYAQSYLDIFDVEEVSNAGED